MSTSHPHAVVMAGIPASNHSLYHRMRFSVGDPAALLELPREGGGRERVLIIRDIEMLRARKHARADRVQCPADFTPAAGLSGDRETATAQAVAECLRRAGVTQAVADRTLPLIYAHELKQAGIVVECDTQLGVMDRRAKDEQEVQWLREAQQATESAMRLACETVAKAAVRGDSVLLHEGSSLTAEKLRAIIDVHLLQLGYANPTSIVAAGPLCADCHEHGHGDLHTGESVIVDIFPVNRATLYNGDCTRTVVHGEASDELKRMHQAVVEAKAAAIAAIRPGVTGEAVHQATAQVIQRHGYRMGLPQGRAADDDCTMPHGTGHGIGLDVHEPPLLAVGGPALVKGDALTVEPGLYCRAFGGVRVEDMVIVTDTGCINLNTLPEGLDWKV
ncbi:MAG: M24 family metallopeptidase [Phycisphaeraceae bacterium]